MAITYNTETEISLLSICICRLR